MGIENEAGNKSNHSLAQVLKSELSNLGWPREDDVVEAEVIRKGGREVYFDLGKFGTGLLFGIEFLNAREIVRKIKAGDSVPAKIVCLDGKDGYIEVSLAEAGKQRLWQQVKELEENGEIVKVKISGANNGGLIANLLDLKAFLPVSQLANEHYPKIEENDRQKILEELKKFIGQELSVKIIDVNPRSKKLIISERETSSVNTKELLSKYEVGQVVDGLVSGVADFGVFVRFVDNPEIEGMIHISEIDHRIVDNPKEIMKINETVKVKIIDIREGRVFLSLKALKTDPWEKIEDYFKAGEEVLGQIYKLNPFGAVVNLENNLQGMIHISEFGGVEEMKKAIEPDKQYKFVIDAVKPQEKRITLKLKK